MLFNFHSISTITVWSECPCNAVGCLWFLFHEHSEENQHWQEVQGPYLVIRLRFNCLLLKKSILRDKCWVKGKIPLLREPAILGRRWTHNPKNRFLTANEGARAFKGEFQGSMGRGDVQSSSGDWSCSGLLSSILIVVSTIFDSGVSLFPFPWGQFVELCEMEQFMSWLQSSHCVINFSHLVGVSVFKGCGSDCYL